MLSAGSAVRHDARCNAALSRRDSEVEAGHLASARLAPCCKCATLSRLRRGILQVRDSLFVPDTTIEPPGVHGRMGKLSRVVGVDAFGVSSCIGDSICCLFFLVCSTCPYPRAPRQHRKKTRPGQILLHVLRSRAASQYILWYRRLFGEYCPTCCRPSHSIFRRREAAFFQIFFHFSFPISWLSLYRFIINQIS
jgi:hypothetical protein